MSPSDTPQPPKPSIAALRTPRILLVDDDPTVLRALRRILRSAHDDWEIVAVSEATAALAAVGERTFDVLVADLDMPGMHGMELLELCLELHPELVRVVHSAQIETANRVRLNQLAFRVLVKPAPSSRIVATVEEALAKRRGRSAMASNGDH